MFDSNRSDSIREIIKIKIKKGSESIHYKKNELSKKILAVGV